VSLDDTDRTPWRDHQAREERRFDRGIHHSDLETERVQYLDMLAEDIAAIEDELAYKRRLYEMAEQEMPEPSTRPSDVRGVKSAGADERETWREVS
jgi:hypothetical protein